MKNNIVRTHVLKIWTAGGGNPLLIDWEIGKSLGYEILPVFISDYSWEDEQELRARIDGLTAGVDPNDVVYYFWPYVNGEKFDFNFIFRMKNRGIFLVFDVTDICSLRGFPPEMDIGKETFYLNLADVLISQSPPMTAWLKEHTSHPKIVEREFWSAFLAEGSASEEKLEKKLVFAGSGNKATFLGHWDYQTELLAFYDYLPFPVAPRIESGGCYEIDELIRKMPKDRFGISWDGDVEGERQGQEYSKYTTQLKVSFYLSLGLPVIVWKESASARLIEKYQLGFALGDLSELDSLMASLTDSDLHRLKARANEFSGILRSGLPTRAAFVEAEKAISLLKLEAIKD